MGSRVLDAYQRPAIWPVVGRVDCSAHALRAASVIAPAWVSVIRVTWSGRSQVSLPSTAPT
jgi:hypothetical protein